MRAYTTSHTSGAIQWVSPVGGEQMGRPRRSPQSPEYRAVRALCGYLTRLHFAVYLPTRPNR